MVSYCIRRSLMSACRLALKPRTVRATQLCVGQVRCQSSNTSPSTSTSSAAAAPVAAAYRLDGRGVVHVSGRDVIDLLQGLVTSDVTEFGDSSQGMTAQYCMMLNVQGRVLFDLIIYRYPEPEMSGGARFLIECDSSLREDFIKTVKQYRIRKKVDITDVSDEFSVWAVPSHLDPTKPLVTPQEGGDDKESSEAPAVKTEDLSGAVVSVADPRVPSFGLRVLFKKGEDTLVEGGEGYDALRYRWGIPEGPSDLPYANCLPLESNLTIMNGVSFLKGCYIGQELTARTHHTGVIRKRLLPLVFHSPVDEVAPDAKVITEAGKTAGKVRGTAGLQGLGLIRLEHLSKPLTVNTWGGLPLTLTAYRPAWWPENLRT